MVRRLLGALLVCLLVAACGAEEDVPEPARRRRSPRRRPPAPRRAGRALPGRRDDNGGDDAGAARSCGRGMRVVNETDGARAVLLDADRLAITASQDAGTTVESFEGLPPGKVDVECTAPGTAEQPATLATRPRRGRGRRRALAAHAVECPQGDEMGIAAAAAGARTRLSRASSCPTSWAPGPGSPPTTRSVEAATRSRTTRRSSSSATTAWSSAPRPFEFDGR